MISVEITSPVVEVVVDNDNISVEEAVTTVEVVVESAIYTGGSGGGVTDHGDLDGLEDDDHPQYQRAESVTTETDWTVTTESYVLAIGADTTITLPDASVRVGRTITVTAGGGDITVAASGADTINGASPTLSLPLNNLRGFTSALIGPATWTWITTNANGNLTDIPAWDGLSIPAGDVVTMGAGGTPEWAAQTAASFGHGTTIDTNLTITDERFLWMRANNLDITFPDAQTNDGAFITIVTQGYTGTTLYPSGTDTIAFNSYYDLPEYTKVVFQSGEYTGQWQWYPVSFDGMLADLPYWYNNIALSVGDTLQIGSGGNPEWLAPTGGAPAAHASTHADGGSDEISVDASQTTSGVFNTARLGTGTADVYHFLDGSGAWNDDVPVLVPCKNTSGSTISKGAPVYVTGTVGSTSVVEVAPADADAAATMPAIGLLNSSLTANATGYVVVVGSLKGLNTSGYTINQALYVSTTAGTLTGTKPTGTSELIQNIGRVTRVGSSTGEVIVLGPGRTNDVPNAIDGAKLTDGTVTSAKILDGTIVNADISASAAIATSKISGLTTVATDTIFDAAGDLAVGSGADTAAKLSKGTRTQALVVGASTLEWDANHFNGVGFVTNTVSNTIAETLPGGSPFGAVAAPGASGVAHLHGIYLPKGTVVTNLSVVSGATQAGTPTNQWFALCNDSRQSLRYTVNDTTAAWAASTPKTLALTSTFTTTYSGLHYIAIVVTATTMPSFRGLNLNVGTMTGVNGHSFLSSTGLTTPAAFGAEGTAFAAPTSRIQIVMGIVS